MDRLAQHPPSVLDFTGWLPIRLYVAQGTLWVDWCFRAQTTLRAPFFHDDVAALLRSPFNLVFRRQTPMADMVTWAQNAARDTGHAPLKAFVAHTSRCGSTLLSQMLAHQPTHVVMAEPTMLDTLLGIGAQLPELSRAEHITWLRALVFALGQTPAHEQHLVIKLDAWHVLQHDLLSAAFPDVPWLFLYRNPIEVAVSQFEQRASFMVPGLVPALRQLAPVADALAMGTEAHIARVLGQIFAAGALLCERGGVRAVNYATLPDALWGELRPLLGLSADAASVAALRATGARNAKSRSQLFAPDAVRKQGSASTLLRAAVSLHCDDAYRRLLALSDAQ